METAPEGGYEMKSPPSGAGRPGRGDTYDWEEIVEWARRPKNHGRHFGGYTNVPSGSVGRYRDRYPDCRFATYNRRKYVGPTGEEQMVVDVVVTCTGAGDANETTDS